MSANSRKRPRSMRGSMIGTDARCPFSFQIHQGPGRARSCARAGQWSVASDDDRVAGRKHASTSSACARFRKVLTAMSRCVRWAVGFGSSRPDTRADLGEYICRLLEHLALTKPRMRRKPSFIIRRRLVDSAASFPVPPEPMKKARHWSA